MSDVLEKALINALLDKYERSSAYKNGTAPERRVMLSLAGNKRSDFPAYDIEDYHKRQAINEAVTALSREGIVSFEWLRGEENHILQCVWLNPDSIKEAYRYVDRTSVKEQITAAIRELDRERALISTEWIALYYEQSVNYMRKKLRFPATLPKDKDERKALFQMLRLIDSASFVSVTERVFSEKCFGDSKYFENHLKSILLSILRKYVGDMSDAELLQFIGISRYPEPLEMRGDIIVNGNEMRAFEKGFCLYSNEIDQARIKLPANLKRIITIENRANFFAYRQGEDELAVYHGGQYSPAKKALFLKLAEALPKGCVWYHWGDIDFGGFSMLLRLRREILSLVQPYRMNREELIRYRDFTRTFADDYAERLQRLSVQEELSDCRECLAYMQEHHVKLEQEAMLLSD